MTYREFYEKIEDIIEVSRRYGIFTEYNDQHRRIIALIEEIEADKKKPHPNFRHSYLPKRLDFAEPVEYAVLTTYRRFINENDRYPKARESLPPDAYIGYWTTVKKAILYTANHRSLGQFGIPKKGVIVFQSNGIKIIEKPFSPRQMRSDSKYHDLVEVGRVEVEGQIFRPKVWRHQCNIT